MGDTPVTAGPDFQIMSGRSGELMMSDQGQGQPIETAKQARERARGEKAYRKASRPFYKKKRVLLPLALLVLIGIIVVASSGGSKKADQAAAKTCVGKTYPDQQSSDVCADPSNGVSLSGLSVVATPFASKSDSAGGKALCSNVTINNTTSSSQDYNELDFKFRHQLGLWRPHRRSTSRARWVLGR